MAVGVGGRSSQSKLNWIPEDSRTPAADLEFARHLVETIGLAAVPGSSFFEHAEKGSDLIRFCFCKKTETLESARRVLARLRG